MKFIHKIWNTSARDGLYHIKSLLGANRALQDGEKICVWCLSTGRVGTATLASLGNLCPKVISKHEPKPLAFGLSRAAYQSGYSATSMGLMCEAVTCIRKNQKDRKKGNVYLETSPQLTFLAPALNEIFGNSKFIHLIRNPSEVIRSGMRRGWYAGHPNDEWRIKPIKGNAIFEQWPKMNQFEKNVWLWTETNQWIVDFLTTIDKENKIVLRSEDLFSADPNKLRPFFSCLGHDLPSAQKISQVIRKRSNHQKTGSFPRFDKWSTKQKETLFKAAGSLIKKFEYQ